MNLVETAVSVIIGMTIAILSFLFQRSINRKDQELRRLEKRVDKHDELFEAMPRDYVMYRDFLTATSRIEGQLANIIAKLYEK